MENSFCAGWAGRLLEGLEDDCPREVRERVWARCAQYHYEVNRMDEALAPFVGDLEGFLEFLARTYGWIITVEKGGGRLLVDENKDHCVCPIAQALENRVSRELCGCSALYARRMFSKVLGREVRAQVRRSFLRDGQSCIYEITY